ncbi:MAG TPA: cytochrome c biogenesis protein CcdA [Candidatus Sulfotelmatobacter sp.]|nr:cytochrome c biogenesis protein CcdA [Candidatus Sulfotelmatobacter sp.]
MRSLPVAAFIAGLISFLSPCVLPLVPGYISLVSGAGIEELKERDGRLMGSVILNSVLFILGFTTTFLALGAVATAIGQLVREHIAVLSRIAGAVIVIFGLHQIGVFPIRWLYADKRFHGLPTGVAGARAFLVGSAFGFGWTPCVGPILAVILTFAAAESTVAKGVSLLAIYALGLAIPFLLTALSIEGFLSFYTRFRSHLHKLEIGSGVVMIAVGVLIFTGHLLLLNNWLNKVPFLRAMAERFL